MLKQKKARILASLLCATVAAGLYTAPVMAEDTTGLTAGETSVTAADTVTINGVTLSGGKVNGVTLSDGKITAEKGSEIKAEYQGTTATYTASSSVEYNKITNSVGLDYGTSNTNDVTVSTVMDTSGVKDSVIKGNNTTTATVGNGKIEDQVVVTGGNTVSSTLDTKNITDQVKKDDTNYTNTVINATSVKDTATNGTSTGTSSVSTSGTNDTYKKTDDTGNVTFQASTAVGASGVKDTVTKGNITTTATVNYSGTNDTYKTVDEQGKETFKANTILGSSGVKDTVTKGNITTTSTVNYSGTNDTYKKTDEQGTVTFQASTAVNSQGVTDQAKTDNSNYAQTAIKTTGITDTVKVNGTDVATSYVSTSGISDKFVYDADNKYYTQVVTNKNGTQFTNYDGSTGSSTYKVTTINGNTATFGKSTSSTYGGQTKISGSTITVAQDKAQTIITGTGITTGSISVGGMTIQKNGDNVEIGDVVLKQNIDGTLAVDALDFDNIKLSDDGFALDATKTKDGFAVTGTTGGFYVKDVSADANGGKSTMVYTKNAQGDDTLYLDTATGNLATLGSISVGNLDATQGKTIIDGTTGNIALGYKKENNQDTQNILLNAENGDITAAGKVTAADVSSAKYSLETVGSDLDTAEGNITTLDGRVGTVENKTTNIAYADGTTTIGNNTLAVSSGNVKMGDKISFNTTNGTITAGKLTLGEMNVGDTITGLQTADTEINGRIDALDNSISGTDGLGSRVAAVENKTGGIERTTVEEDNTQGSGLFQHGTKTTTNNTDIENGALSVTQKTETTYYGPVSTDTTTTSVDVADGALKVEKVGGLIGTTTTSVDVADGALKVTKDPLGITSASIADGTVTITGVGIGDTGVGLMNVNAGMNVNGVMNVTGVSNFTGLATFNGGTVTNGLAVFNGGLAVTGVAGMSVEGGLKVTGGMHLDGIQYVNGDIIVNDSEGNELYSLTGIGYNTQDISYANGVTTVGGVDFNNGSITAADSITAKGKITTADDVVAGTTSLKEVGTRLGSLEGTVGETNANVAGIKRDALTNTTTIEDATSFDASGMAIEKTKPIGEGKYVVEGSTHMGAGEVTFDTLSGGTTNINGGQVIASQDVVANGVSLVDVGANVAGIKRNALTNTTTIEGATSFDQNGMWIDSQNGTTSVVGGQATFENASGSTNINGSQIITEDVQLDTINGVSFSDLVQAGDITNIAGIERDADTGITTIEGATSFDANGMTIESLNGTTAMVGGQATFIGADGTNTQIVGGAISTGSLTVGGIEFKGFYDDVNTRLKDLENKTQNITESTGSEPGTGEGGSTVVPPTTDGQTGIKGDVTVGGAITAGSGDIGGVKLEGNAITAEKGTLGSLNVADGKVTAGADGVTVSGTEEGNNVKIDGNDVNVTWKDAEGNSQNASIKGNYEAINSLDNRVTNEVNRLDNRISDVEDRVDKVGAMSAAIANLRTMGYDPAAPTEIAVGVGQYRSETGVALGLFHYPRRDFMLSLSVSTAGDEVMGGVGATWRIGRKSPEQMKAAKEEKAKKEKLAKAEAMKKAATEAKVAEQQARHAKLAAERAAK